MNEPPSPAEPRSPRRVAAFDFDGTLVRRDTLMPFLAKVAGLGRLASALAGQARTYRSDRDAAKVDVIRRLMTDHSADRIEALGRDYAIGLTHLLRPEMSERVRWHRSEGHELVIVSASLGVYLRPFAETLGFDHVISVELESDDAGQLTGALRGPNVRGPEKARRLTEWFGDDPPLELWTYGNSSGDDELLAMGDYPFWLGRRAKLNP